MTKLDPKVAAVVARWWRSARDLDVLREDLAAADVRVVVTCGECRHRRVNEDWWWCVRDYANAEWNSLNWFCADGEREGEG